MGGVGGEGRGGGGRKSPWVCWGGRGRADNHHLFLPGVSSWGLQRGGGGGKGVVCVGPDMDIKTREYKRQESEKDKKKQASNKQKQTIYCNKNKIQNELACKGGAHIWRPCVREVSVSPKVLLGRGLRLLCFRYVHLVPIQKAMGLCPGDEEATVQVPGPSSLSTMSINYA